MDAIINLSALPEVEAMDISRLPSQGFSYIVFRVGPLVQHFTQGLKTRATAYAVHIAWSLVPMPEWLQL